MEICVIVGGRKQVGARVAIEGGPTRPSVKGTNFNMLEEEQLCRSVFFMSRRIELWGINGELVYYGNEFASITMTTHRMHHDCSKL